MNNFDTKNPKSYTEQEKAEIAEACYNYIPAKKHIPEYVNILFEKEKQAGHIRNDFKIRPITD
ncbi:hypothetical protein FACS1894166_10130 [Bacilli bacterium]|nr:hypothetical protein FACS1894166_10130 [Bacilli bacterium]